jgi:hypothetical protein
MNHRNLLKMLLLSPMVAAGQQLKIIETAREDSRFYVGICKDSIEIPGMQRVPIDGNQIKFELHRSATINGLIIHNASDGKSEYLSLKRPYYLLTGDTLYIQEARLLCGE